MYSLPADNRTLGWQVIDWCTEYVLQPDGPAAGTPWVFTPEQLAMVLKWYEIDHAGRFTFRRGVIRRMKGWGKDPLIAVLSLAEACGPVRFSHWDGHGYPVGIPHPAPLIQIAAVSLVQTKNTMTLFPGMISPELKKKYSIDPGKEIIYVRNGAGRIEAVTSSPRSLEGNRPTLVVLNESHLWLANNEGIEMADVIRRNLGKSRDGAARSIEITNAHLPGEGSVAEVTYNAVQSGDIKGVWYDSLEAPDVPDLTDREALAKALMIARGDSDWIDIDRLCDEINDPATPEYVARRFYLNQVVVVDIDRWLPQGSWAKCADNDRHIAPDDRVVLAIDGMYNGDSTGVVACSIDYVVPHFEKVGLWERPDSIRNWHPPLVEIFDTIRAALKKWRVAEIAVDPALWQTDLDLLLQEGYPVVEFQMRGQRMIDATQRLYETITQGLCTHNGDPDMARHFAAAWVKNPLLPRLQKEPGENPPHIDLAVGCVMAGQRAAEIGMEEEYANFLFPSDYAQDRKDEQPRISHEPKILEEKDYLVPNQFNIGPKRNV